MRTLTRSTQPILPDTYTPSQSVFFDCLGAATLSLVFYDEQAVNIFDNASSDLLPPLPWGYHWQKVENAFYIFRLMYAMEYTLQIVLYGPDETGRINYNFLVDQRNTFSLCHTRNDQQQRLTPKDRQYPDLIKSNASGYRSDTQDYTPGHCGDHVDSIIPPNHFIERYGKKCISSYDDRNYIPEIKRGYWGFNMRKGLVGFQRKHHHPYAQLVEYPDTPKVTLCKTAIPESVYFYRIDNQYKPQQVCWIEWQRDYLKKTNRNMSMIDYAQSFSTNLNTAPRALVWDLNRSPKNWKNHIKAKLEACENIRANLNNAAVNRGRDQLYLSSDGSSVEYKNIHATIALVLAAADFNKVNLTKAALLKAAKHGEKLMNSDSKASLITTAGLNAVVRYHHDNRPGFTDDIVDLIRQLSL